MNHPNPLNPLGQLNQCDDTSLVNALNRCKAELDFNFKDQDELGESFTYEAYVYRNRCIPTRANLHDFFNGLSWIKFSQTKEAMLNLQAAEFFKTSPHSVDLKSENTPFKASAPSARDTFLMLYNKGALMHSKPFSIGYRIEHPQGLIDKARWGQHAGNPLLGAADYRLVHHARNGRAVYSFCMCPGGTVVAATSEAGRVVTNGMSQYSRNERNANAAIVVGIEPSDYPTEYARFERTLGSDFKGSTLNPSTLNPSTPHPLAGIVLQRELESSAYVLGESSYKAPAQRLEDFLSAKASKELGSVVPSYKPGVLLTDLGGLLPQYATEALREALPAFALQVKGFDLPDAVLTGVETRTSSPLRIERDAVYENPALRGLYPAGEGAGFAGGILSAGVDGLKVAEAVAKAIAQIHA